MVNITHKPTTLRKAIASARVTVSLQTTIDAIVSGNIPKGNVFEFSRAAGLLAIKKTSDVIPDCHPLPVEYAAITHRIDGKDIVIEAEVHTIYRTGVEVEAMHGAAITALTIYDMLKPVDERVEIGQIKLENKKGGKGEFCDKAAGLRCAVLVCSDSVYAGRKTDKSGLTIIDKLRKHQVETESYEIIPDDFSTIQSRVRSFTEMGYNLLLLTGGTGLSPRDVTPEAILPLLDRPVPGIAEMLRGYGQQRTPYAMLSRGVAGFVKNMLVITLPGSARGVEESMNALFPSVLHIFSVAEGMRHN